MSVESKTEKDEINLIEIIKILLQYKKLFFISGLLFLIVFFSIYLLKLKSKIEFIQTIVFYTDMPQSILKFETKKLKADLQSKNKFYVIGFVSENSNNIIKKRKIFFKKLEQQYAPLLKKRMNKILSLSKKIETKDVFVYDIYIFENSGILKKSKYSLSKIFKFFIFTGILIIFLDIFIIFIIEFLNKSKFWQ